MNEPQRNPYDPQRPAVDPSMFFGRDDVFAFIRQRLVTGRRAQTIAIIGQRGMGKTSVLLQIANQIESRFMTAYIDLADVRFDAVGGLFATMADAARQALETAGLSTVHLPPAPQDPGVDLLKWFSETYLDATLSGLRRGRRLIFLFDDTTKLLDAIDRRDIPEDFGETLSQLIARDERLDIIFAVNAEDESRLENFAPLNDPLLHKRLGLLDDASAEALIRRPVAPFYEVQPDAVEGILSMAGGYPYLLHVINGLIWERAMARRQPGPITLNDVNAVVRQATDESDPVLRLVWEHSTTNERLTLSALTALTSANRGMPIRVEDVRVWLLRESDVPLDETAIASALRRLEYREVLRATANGLYTFTTGLQHQWLVLNGDAQPTSTVRSTAHPSPRRLAIPAVLLIGAVVLIALLIGRLATVPPATDPQASPTVTLVLDVAATRKSQAITQTFQAMPTATITHTPTHTATVTASFTLTLAPTATETATATFTDTVVPTSTGTVTPAPTNTATPIPPTSTLTLTPIPPTLTYTATATIPPSDTPTNTVTATNTPTITNTPLPTDTATITSTASRTPFPSLTPSPPLTITPPPFPTAQLRATSTLNP